MLKVSLRATSSCAVGKREGEKENCWFDLLVVVYTPGSCRQPDQIELDTAFKQSKPTIK